MKKIIMSIPFIFFILFVSWGFIIINTQNTKVFNGLVESSQNIDFEKMQDLGLDFKIFIKDKSEIKIHRSSNKGFYIEYKNYEIDFSNSVVEAVIINFIDGTDYVLSKLGNGVGSVIKKIETIV